MSGIQLCSGQEAYFTPYGNLIIVGDQSWK